MNRNASAVALVAAFASSPIAVPAAGPGDTADGVVLAVGAAT